MSNLLWNRALWSSSPLDLGLRYQIIIWSMLWAEAKKAKDPNIYDERFYRIDIVTMRQPFTVEALIDNGRSVLNPISQRLLKPTQNVLLLLLFCLTKSYSSVYYWVGKGRKATSDFCVSINSFFVKAFTALSFNFTNTVGPHVPKSFTRLVFWSKQRISDTKLTSCQ